MLFSVIIPAYNAERYFLECLNSIESQSFKDYELIIIDDGSFDGTSVIADQFSSGKDNVYVIHQTNSGPLAARIAGLNSAKGEYAIFVDADDCIRADTLEKISEAIYTYDADIVSFQYTRKSDFSFAEKRSLMLSGFYPRESFEKVIYHFCSGQFNELWGKAIRLSCFDLSLDYSQYYNLMHGEDLLQLLPVFDRARSLYSLNEVLYFYRPNELSNTAKYRSSQLNDIQKVNYHFLRYAAKWGKSFYLAACKGEILQYINILRIVISSFSIGQSFCVLKKMHDTMQQSGLFSRTDKIELRVDHMIIFYCVKFQWYSCAYIIMKLISVLKRYD
ncbi:glycosyltransferase family 2 protein [Bifidobacterium moukalabense]|uniref:glycosyltransferase family 2 protein n=1 Tax=Bifidobacterium moukalabense TaxID=1333651 RepID=UPI0010F98707|nr:glycosyltransferase family 2 protein [Bifidobacterium moukalabense]